MAFSGRGRAKNKVTTRLAALSEYNYNSHPNHVSIMKASDFYYNLPQPLIAQRPLSERGSSRLLVLDPLKQTIMDDVFSHLGNLIEAGDLLVFNDTRVLPARLFGQKESGGTIEVMVERLLEDGRILAHIRSSKSPRPGSRLLLEGVIDCVVTRRDGEFFVLQHSMNSSWLDLLQQFGRMPLPPYIQRADEENDRERYQTVFADKPGAVAAPTAGLHFDENMIQSLLAKGVQVAYITLHVGAGTFQPVRVDKISEHVMHAEMVKVSPQVCERIKHTRMNGGRVVAIGTTVVRSLESAAQDGRIKPFAGDTRLFITPGFTFNVVDAMLTNFHLPRSTLLMLVSAFAGKELVFQAYRHAVEQQYRFFSYGDAMFIRNLTRSVE